MKLCNVKKRLLSIILSFSLIFTLVGCSSQPYKMTNILWDNEIAVILDCHKTIDDDTVHDIKVCLDTLLDEVGTYSENSIVNKFNNSSSGETFNLNDYTYAYDFFYLAKVCNEISSKFNPFVYPLLSLWKLDDNFNPGSLTAIPSAQEISELLPLTDFNSAFYLDTENFTVTKLIDNAKLDFNGILKGYAINLIAEQLTINRQDVDTGYINVGNSSLLLYSVTSLDIRHPEKPDQIILSIDGENIKDTAVSTSGNYQRYYEIDGQKYCHIINDDGYPINTGIISATVVGKSHNGGITDALSTAICCYNHDPDDFSNSELVSFLKSSALVEFDYYIAYNKDGVKQIITNKKQGEHFSLLDSSFTVKSI